MVNGMLSPSLAEEYYSRNRKPRKRGDLLETIGEERKTGSAAVESSKD